MLVLAGLGTVECVSADGCLGTVENGVLTITGDLKIVSVDPDLDSDTVMLLAELAVDMLPVDPGPTPATAAQMTAAAATKVTAIDKEAAQAAADDAGLGGSDVDEDAEAYTLTIERDSDGTTVEIKDPAYLKTADPKFIQQDVDLGEGRTMLVRVNSDDEDGKVEEVVIVKTDIKAAKATPLTLDFDLDNAVDTDGDDVVDNDYTALEVMVANLSKIKSAAFTRPGTHGDIDFPYRHREHQHH